MSNLLRLWNLGFLFYMVEGDRCGTVVIPIVDIAPHRAALAIDRTSAHVDGDPPLVEFPGADDDLLLIDVAGTSLSCETAADATLGRRTSGADDEPDFDWVPDFTQTCTGVQLNPDWRAVARVATTFALAGGELEAVADFHTCDGRWTWTSPDGGSHTQRATTMTRYSMQSEAPITITIASRTSGREWAVTFDSDDAEAYLVNLPASFFDRQLDPEPGGLIDLGHITAGLSFCMPSGQAITVPTRMLQRAACRHASRSKSAVSRFAGPFDRFVIVHDGTIECSNQQFPVA